MSDARLDLLVRASWPHLVRTAYLLTGSLATAEDVTRDAVRRRLRDGRAVPESELRDAVVREAFRHRALYAAGSAPFAEQGDTAGAVLRQLPLDERAVLVLRHREGLSVEQTVDVLRVPAGVVREREGRALRAAEALRTADAHQGEPDALRALLTEVADTVTPSPPPDLDSLLETAQGRRMLVFGLVALVVALLAAARWLL